MARPERPHGRRARPAPQLTAAPAASVAGAPRSRLGPATVVVVVAIATAYHYSLLTLVRGFGLDSPLAYLGLVPFLALGLAVHRMGLPHRDPGIVDRYTDLVVGVPLLLAALLMLIVVPVGASSFYWLWRIDLLSLPLFAAGAVSVLFGVRTLARLRAPLAFLVLAWPPLYGRALGPLFDGAAGLTTTALAAVLHYLPVASPVTSADGSLFSIGGAAQGFVVSVAAACGGTNGVVGFLLVGLAFTLALEGRLLPHIAWLALGAAVVWCANLGRLLVIMWSGQQWGERVALGALHPFIGLLAFCLAIAAMIAIAPWFGLRPRQRASSAPFRAEPAPTSRRRLAFAFVALVTVVAAGANAALAPFALLSHDLGTPRLHPLTTGDLGVAGWRMSQTASYPWAVRYFGASSSWNRYTYNSDVPPAGGSGGATAPVTLDVISTADLETFSVYGLDACYRFHNYRVLEERRFDAGGGVVGHSLAYYNPRQRLDWVAVYWEWPVTSGTGQAYERVVLTSSGNNPATPAADLSSPAPTRALGLLLGGLLQPDIGPTQRRDLTATRDSLVAFSHLLIASLVRHTAASEVAGP